MLDYYTKMPFGFGVAGLVSFWLVVMRRDLLGFLIFVAGCVAVAYAIEAIWPGLNAAYIHEMQFASRANDGGALVPAVLIGTMIEVPRAALIAGQIAAHADFFSFGTNDLTQMTYGYSRDDIGRFLPQYIESGVLPHDPFASLDEEGVGQLVRLACERGRAARADLHLGVCGEHGGDPDTVKFCHKIGLNYVSCSPFRVAVARLAAAQAALGK